jgi:hypothetical protein
MAIPIDKPVRDEYDDYQRAYGSPQPVSPLYRRWGMDQGIAERKVLLASGGRRLRPGERP